MLLNKGEWASCQKIKLYYRDIGHTKNDYLHCFGYFKVKILDEKEVTLRRSMKIKGSSYIYSY